MKALKKRLSNLMAKGSVEELTIVVEVISNNKEVTSTYNYFTKQHDNDA